MKVIIGTYRGPELVKRALISILDHAYGVTEIVIVDDSGNPEWLQFYRNLLIPLNGRIHLPTILDVGKLGYNYAMKVVVSNGAQDPYFAFWEEDFVLTEPVDFAAMGQILRENPDLIQLALLRGPHFPIEHQYGGLLPALQARKPEMNLTIRETVHDKEDTFWVQDGTFTCNPAVWSSAGLRKASDNYELWPSGAHSEDQMTDRALRAGLSFGYLRGERVVHDGKRSGHGY